MKDRINSERKKLEGLASQVLDICRQKGAEQCIVKINKDTGLTVSSHDCAQEEKEFNKSRGIAITVLKNEKKGNASTSDISLDAINKTAEAAIEFSAYAEVDPAMGLADPELMVREAIDLDRCYPEEPDAEVALKEAIALDKMCQGRDPRIAQVRKAAYSNRYGISVYANSHGVLQSEPYSVFAKNVLLVSEHENKMHMGGSFSYGCKSDLLWDNERIAKDAVEDAVALVGARSIPTGNYPVIFRREEATGLFMRLLGAISGMAQFHHSTFLDNALGRQVLPSFIDVCDRPLIKQGLSSQYFDEDGLKTGDISYVSRGVVENYRLSVYSARKLGLKPNGTNYGSSNFEVIDHNAPNLSFDDLLVKMDRGFLVTQLMGQGVNDVTGDYSRGASGFWVENGKIQFPVEGVTIAGNLKDMLRNIVAVGADYDERYTMKTGSVLLDSQKIAGA